MQGRRSTTIRSSYEPSASTSTAKLRSSRRSVSEQRPSRQNLSDVKSIRQTKTTPAAEMRLRQSEYFPLGSKSPSSIWSRLTPPSRPPTSFAQVELRKLLLEENLKLARSLQGLKKQSEASKLSWRMVLRNKAILASLVGTDWDSNPRLHKNSLRTPTRQHSRENITMNTKALRADKSKDRLNSNDVDRRYQVLQSIYGSREPSSTSITARDSGPAQVYSQLCPLTGGLSINEIQDWVIKHRTAQEFGTTKTFIPPPRRKKPISSGTTSRTEMCPSRQSVSSNHTSPPDCPDCSTNMEPQPISDTNHEASSTEVSIRDASSPHPEPVPVKTKRAAEPRKETAAETDQGRLYPPAASKSEEGVQAEEAEVFHLPEIVPSNLRLSEQTAMRLIHYQSQQIKALLHLAQQKSTKQESSVESPLPDSPTSFWNQKRLFNWVANSMVTETNPHLPQSSDSKGSVTSGSTAASELQSELEFLTAVNTFTKPKSCVLTESPPNLVGVSAENLASSNELTCLNLIKSHHTSVHASNQITLPAESLSSTRKSLGSTLTDITDLPLPVLSSIHFDGSNSADGTDKNTENIPDNELYGDKICLPEVIPTMDSGISKDIIPVETTKLENTSSAHNTTALTGTTPSPSFHSSLVANGTSQTTSKTNLNDPAVPADCGRGQDLRLRSSSNGNFLAEDTNNNDGYDGDDDDTKSLDYFSLGSGFPTSLSSSRKRCKARRVRRKVSFSNPVAMYKAVPVRMQDGVDVDDDANQQLTFCYSQTFPAEKIKSIED